MVKDHHYQNITACNNAHALLCTYFDDLKHLVPEVSYGWQGCDNTLLLCLEDRGEVHLSILQQNVQDFFLFIPRTAGKEGMLKPGKGIIFQFIKHEFRPTNSVPHPQTQIGTHTYSGF